MKLVTFGTKRSPRSAGLPFRDDFDRPNGALSNNWRDVADERPTSYPHLGILDGWVNIPYPRERPGSPFAGDAISAAYQECNTENVTVELYWVGDGDTWQLRHQHEAAPCVHYVVGTSTLAFGIWPSTLVENNPGATGVFWMGTIGDPPELFAVDAYGLYPRDANGHRVSVTSINGRMTFKFDGSPIQIYRAGDNAPLSYVSVPAELRGSTKHGFEVDGHLDPVPETQFMDWVTIDTAS